MRAKLAWAYLAAAVAAALPGPAAAQERTPTAISDIRQESNERSTRLTVECSGPLAYTYYSPDPLTLVVDIPEMDASKVPSRINVASREVESIRVTSMARADGRSLARLEVRLASLAPYQIYSKGKELTLIFERPAALAKAEPIDPAKANEPLVFVPSKPRAAARPETKPAPQQVAEAAPAPMAPPAAKEPAVHEKAPAEPKPASNAPKASKILGVSSSTRERAAGRDREGRRHAPPPGLLPGQPQPPRGGLPRGDERGPAAHRRRQRRPGAKGAHRPVQHHPVARRSPRPRLVRQGTLPDRRPRRRRARSSSARERPRLPPPWPPCGRPSLPPSRRSCRPRRPLPCCPCRSCRSPRSLP